MCIVPFPVISISSTKLFVLPSVDRKRQMTFYKNTVDSKDENLMILPFPNAKSLQLHKIKYKALFDDLKQSVFQPPTRSWGLYEMNMTRSLCSTASFLPVISHGSYLVSIAETLEELNRINPTVFDLPEGIFDFFRKHYTSEFGYLVCKLKEGKQLYEPLCYSHSLLSNGKLFVPTLHYHDHGQGAKTDEADWDHVIYSLGTTKMANREYLSYKENKLLWNRFPEEYTLGKEFPVRCAEIYGNYPNKDVVFELEVHGTQTLHA
jgi:hypothetical protein